MNSILIVDDHDLFREGLKRIIEHWPDYVVVGEASSGEEALESVRRLKPNLVLMDISMPVMSGLEATRTIAKEFSEIKVIMLTASEEDEDLFNAINAGACGYIPKNIKSPKFHELLQDAVAGQVALSSRMASKITNEFKRRSIRENEPDFNELSEREVQILELVTQGLTNAEIAKKLYLSEHSIKKYLCGILDKLHMNNRVEAAVYAVREGIFRKDKPKS